ncbi:iron-sulfur cluster-binding domain-containing protein [Nocardioides sp.]|uniref:flavin reductase family protein n=1 Tax=Nocardioides sp. TaxID=35761 RepID=UPI001D65774C|nr:iron-sulfur cluster-binding domain-containing protein [Nocardioides sp.]MBU1801858.1 iron-sulfur cluster-binding domain-containing protein [Actinomycetota bacterium]
MSTTLASTVGGRMLRSRVVAALASPHGVDRYLELVNPMWAAEEVRARVVDVRRENADSDGAPVATLTLQPTSTWRGHRAGQYVQVGVDLPDSGKRMTRCFSISSASSLPGEQIALTIRAHDEGQVSKYLVSQAQPGQMVHLSQAEGEFTLHESAATPTNNHLLFITGGSGITPAMSILRTLLRDGYDGRAGRKVTFLHYARSAEDQIFAAELAEIAEADNDVTVHLRHGDHVFSDFELRRLVPDYRDTDTWACGPAGLMELIHSAYTADEVLSARLRTEFFKPPRVATGAAEGDVSFDRSGTGAANTGATLLEQAEALGLTPEFGCRMGICFSCTSRKTEGTVRNVLTGAESSLPDEDIQICVTTPVGDCAVDL